MLFPQVNQIHTSCNRVRRTGFYRIAKILKISLICLSTVIISTAYADDSMEKGFFATWRLLGAQDKQQFISGYLRGWKDAQQVTEVAISYVEQNPKNALEGLKSLRGLYEVGSLSPDALVKEIDAFFKNPDNTGAPLSAAITSVKRSALH